jgi:quinol monooxygenase YgiN
MWAQLITTRLKPGKEDALPRLSDQLRALEQPGSGLVRSLAMRDQKEPSRVYMLVVFESE